MKTITSTIFIVLISLFGYSQTSGIFESYAILEINNGTIYYDCQANTDNPDFDNNHLGQFSPNSDLLLKGGEIKTWKDGGGDVTGSFMYYRVYRTEEEPGNFNQIILSFAEDLGNNDQKWHNRSENI